MGYWKRFINWCQRPEMIKIRLFNPNIGGKHLIKNLFQTGLVIMGFIGPVLLFNSFLSPHPYHSMEELFLGILFSGLGLMSLGIILKAKKRFNPKGKTLLHIGVVYTLIWIIGYTARIGNPLDVIRYGYPIISIPVLMLGVYPTLGSILMVSGIVPKEKTEKKVKSLKGRDMGRWKRFIQWNQRPGMIKIRRFSPSITIVAIALMETVSLFVVIPGLFGPLVNISGINIPTNTAVADLLPLEIAGEPLASGSIGTETLYTVVCMSALVAEVPDGDIDNIKFQVEYTRAQYNEIVIHVLKVPSDYSWQSQGVFQILLWDNNWYGNAYTFPKKGYSDLTDRFTTRKGGRSLFFFRSGNWIFGVDAENYLIRNRFANDFIQNLDVNAPQGMAMLAESGYIVSIIVIMALILGTSILWGKLLGRFWEDYRLGKLKLTKDV